MMTEEDNLERIQRSFVRSTEECPPEVACLLTVMKYYRVKGDARELREKCTKEGKITMMGMRDAASSMGMESSLGILNIEKLSRPILPQILFCYNDCEKPLYMVCYGLFNGCFILWEPTWGVLHYGPQKMERQWIKGITLFLNPTDEFMKKAEEIKWWDLSPYKEWRRKIMRWHETAWLNMPLYRKICGMVMCQE